MRRVYGLAGAVALSLGAVLPAAAQDTAPRWRTTGDLARFCRMDDRTFCYGFMTGAWQFYEALVAQESLEIDPFVCPPDEVSGEEAASVFLAWVDAHPENLGETGVNGLFRAWSAAYPCT